MSFWPFGQNINSPTNNINKILDEYFSVLHTIEQKQHHVNTNYNNIASSLGSGGITITRTNSNSRTSLTHNDNDSIIHSNENDDYNRQVTNNDIHGPLNNKFIDEILNESEIINELNRKNNTLLDFICFGYFFETDSQNTCKVSNIEYLVNLLMQSCTKIDEHLNNERLKSTNATSDELLNDNDNIMNNDYDQLNDMDKLNENQTAKTNDSKTVSPTFHDDDTITTNFLDEKTNSKPLALKPSNLMSPANSNHNISRQSSYSTGRKDGNQNIDFYLKKCELIGEIFSLNIWLITESLVKSSVFLARFWSLLSLNSFSYESSPISSVFLKINTNLLINKQDQFLNFVRTFLFKPGSLTSTTSDKNLFENDKNITVEDIQALSKTNGLVDDMLKYIDSSLLNDFFLKIISTDKQDTPTGIIELVYDQDLVFKLLDFFKNDVYEAEIQTCSCDFFKAIIAISANAPIDDLTIGPNCLTRQLCTDPAILDKMLSIILNEGSHALGNVVSIVIELIRKNNSDYDQLNLLQTSLKLNPPNSRDPIYLGYMVKKFTENLHLVFALLQTPYNNKPNDSKIFECDQTQDKSVRLNAMNEFFTPLGFEQFRIVELIAELLHCSNMGLMNSRRAERISRKRDTIRAALTSRLEEALSEMKVFSKGEEVFHEDIVSPQPSPVSLSPRLTDEASGFERKGMIHSVPASDTSSPVDERSQSIHDLNGKGPKSDTSSLSTQSAPSQYATLSGDKSVTHATNGPIFQSDSNIHTSDIGGNLDKLHESSFYDFEEQQISQISEMDEFFDIPYVSIAQNKKIRENPTIGDYFKIRLVDLQILPYLVSMFLKYPWNNFWHNVIFDILQQIFNGRMDYAYNSFLVYSLFNNKLIDQFWDKEDSLNFNGGKPIDFNLCADLVINGYRLSNAYYFKNRFSLGYMGHLVLIAEEIVKFSKIYKVDLISPDIQASVEDVKWTYYVEDILMDTRLMFSKILGGDIISTNGPEEEFLLKQQQVKRQKELLEMGLLDSLESDELLLYSTQDELQQKLKTRLLERTNKEVEQELLRLAQSKADHLQSNDIFETQLLEGTDL